MSALETSLCVDRDFYAKHLPDVGFEEARAVLIGGFAEQELKADLSRELTDHLSRCDCCGRILKSLQELSDLAAGSGQVIRAVCPSAENLDAYLFERNELVSAEADRIQEHLMECPLCQEEVEWLRKLDEGSREPEIRVFRKWPELLALAAAFVFFALSVALLWQNHTHAVQEEELRALAVIKAPDQIDFRSLKRTSKPLEGTRLTSYDEAVEFILQRDYARAATLLEEVFQGNQDHSGSAYLLGYCYYHLNQPERAFDLCDRAEGMEPHSIERCLGLVHIALKTGHFGRAVKEISALYHGAPHVPEVRTLYDQITKLTSGRSVRL